MYVNKNYFLLILFLNMIINYFKKLMIHYGDLEFNELTNFLNK